jgi:hypothetical protein
VPLETVRAIQPFDAGQQLYKHLYRFHHDLIGHWCLKCCACCGKIGRLVRGAQQTIVTNTLEDACGSVSEQFSGLPMSRKKENGLDHF